MKFIKNFLIETLVLTIAVLVWGVLKIINIPDKNK